MPQAMDKRIKFVEETFTPKNDLPDFKVGDTITVHYKIIEGGKERTQSFQGIDIKKRGKGNGKTFTVRKKTQGIGVERIFSLHSPKIHSVKLDKRGKTKRSKLYYLRKVEGRKARVEEER
jgi:large subunit ribosomal protein L19